MSETNTSVDPLDLHLTDEEISAGATLVEFEGPPEALDALARLIADATPDEVDDGMTLDEEWRVNQEEKTGVERPYRDGFVMLRSIESARGKLNKLTKEYRLKHKGDAGSDLDSLVQEAIYREALFNTSVAGWRSFNVGGKDWPFDWAHWCKAWGMVRFRNWVLAELGKMGTKKSPVLEQVRGN